MPVVYDVIVIGAGFGGLSCAALCAKMGRRVLVLEKKPRWGGTSSVFFRKGFSFPMGALGFSHPGMILDCLDRLDIKDKPTFTRNHFQLRSPDLDLVYSLPFQELRLELERLFPRETGIKDVFTRLESLMNLVGDIHLWHPSYSLGTGERKIHPSADSVKSRRDAVEEAAKISGNAFLERHLSHRVLKNFLGSMGTGPPHMSLLNMAFMWQVMCSEGIWTPSCGIHGLGDLLGAAAERLGAEIRTSCEVGRILFSEGRATGVKTTAGEILDASWVVSNADGKKTFLELMDEGPLPRPYLKWIRERDYTGSELCVYLGIDSEKVDWSPMRARHLFYRMKDGAEEPFDPEDFTRREMEICRWSRGNSFPVPRGKESLLLRVGFPYHHFGRFRTGEKRRTADYGAHKAGLAEKLTAAAEDILPGLRSAVEVTESATPLTYRDWGQRFLGSIAGWHWGEEKAEEESHRLIVITPVPNLLLAGIYASKELFLGGISTAVYTGRMAAELISASS